MSRLVLLLLAAAGATACSSPGVSLPTDSDVLAPIRFAPSSAKLDEGGNLPFGCEGVTFRAGAAVSGKRVDVRARIDASALDGTWGRVVFWPLGRHVGPRIVSELFHTARRDDFPIEAALSFTHPDSSAPGDFFGNVDFEMLSVCFEENLDRFLPGGLDPFGSCVPGEHIVLQCDRGVAYRIE